MTRAADHTIAGLEEVLLVVHNQLVRFRTRKVEIQADLEVVHRELRKKAQLQAVLDEEGRQEVLRIAEVRYVSLIFNMKVEKLKLTDC